MLHQVNPYIKDLKSAIDKESYKVIIHADKKSPEEHRGRYNAPTTNEVALVLVDQQAKVIHFSVLVRYIEHMMRYSIH
ncbi:unnamed protein product [Parnassius mnemosyne]|uniref:Uncharacterized protein n=1 Tax=Parnassius mnemosyne TaxID=213953 RepID=A0AAV1LYV7_9NEOP